MSSSPSTTSPNGLKPKPLKLLTLNLSSHSYIKKSSADMECHSESQATKDLNLSMNLSRPLPEFTRSITSRQLPITLKEIIKPNASIVSSRIFSRKSHYQRRETGIIIFKVQSM